MISNFTIIDWIAVSVVASPAMLLAVIGLSLLAGLKLTETVIAFLTQCSVVVGLLASILMLVYMLASGERLVELDLHDWVAIHAEDFHFHLKFIFDRLSIPFVILTFVLCGTIGVFTRRYLHRDSGYRRFFMLYALFFTGMVVSAVSGTIETLFFGWELVGLSSALLVAYFHERENPVRNGQRVWSTYRIADAAFLLAALAMHHVSGQGDFSAFVGQGPWPNGETAITGWSALLVGSLLLIAAAGKSALIPFSGWLPRAMEGPTPSSAVFYGSLSVHLGAYLLLRVSPIIQASLALQIMVVALGLLSAIAGSIISHVQSDVKSSLAFASLTQVGIIIVEIGLGLYYIALIHILGHACMRTLQLLRAPSLLLDYQSIENAIGSRVSDNRSYLLRLMPRGFTTWLYRFGYDRGFMDTILDRFVVEPFLFAFRTFDRWERAWTDWLSREPSRQSDLVQLHPEEIEGEAA